MTNSPVLRWVAAVLFTFAGAQTAHAQYYDEDEAELNPGWIGGACEGAFDCFEPGFTTPPQCATVGFPGGMCTQRCERSVRNTYVCPDADTSRATLNTGTFCIATPANHPACVTRCNFNKSDTGCRPGYSCVEQSRFGAPLIAAEVCLPTDSQGWPKEAALRPYQPALNLHRVEAELPGPEVFAITQDAGGYMWIATPNGLAKYDGLRVTDSPTLSDNNVLALLADKDGSLWVGTEEGGLNHLEGTQATVYGVKDGLSSPTVTSIAPGPPGELFVGTLEGLNRINLETSKVEVIGFIGPNDPKGISHPMVRSLLLDGNALWIGTAAGLDRLDLVKNEIEHFGQNLVAGGAVTALAKQKDGRLWIGSERGLYSLFGDEFSYFPHDPEDPGSLSAPGVTTLLVDAGGSLWVGTGGEAGGLNRLDKTGDRFSHYLPKQYMTSVFQDRDAVVWLGVKYTADGLWKVPPANFKTYRAEPDEPNALHGAINWGVYPEPGGVLWVGTMLDGAGLYRVDRESGQVVRFVHDASDPYSLSDSNVISITDDGEGGLWVGTLGGGLNRFDPLTAEVERYAPDPEGFPAATVWAVANDKAGRLWIGTQTHGLIEFDADEEAFVVHEEASTSPTERNVIGIFPDQVKPEILWLTTAGGLVMYNTTTKARVSYAKAPGSPHRIGDVVHIHQDPAGLMWLATVDNGLNRLNRETNEIVRYDSKDGLPGDAIACVVGDNDGMLWVVTYKGIARFDPKTKAVITFDESDGVQVGEPLDGRCFRNPRSGEILMSGLGGLVVLDPRDITLDSRPPGLEITSVKRFGEDLPLSVTKAGNQVASFGYRDVLSVSFAVLSYGGESASAYRLEGLDDDWLTASADRTVTYSYLPPGHYNFQIKGSNRHGVWNEKISGLEFDVAPPWFRTWWAYSFYLLIVLSLAGAYWWFQQLKVLRVREQMRLAELETDLGLAGAAQSWFLPKASTLDDGSLSLCGFYEPATKCGGDWWWHERADDVTQWLLVADVTGHGAGAAILTSSVATAFRVVSTDAQGRDIRWRLNRLHQEIWTAVQGRLQMTLTAVEFNEVTGEGHMFNAGGWPVLCQSAEGVIRAITRTGTPLGGSAEPPTFGEREFKIAAGERMFIYTDGLPETTMENGKLVGLRRFRKMIGATREVGINDAIARIVSETTAMRGPPDPEDDVTIIGAEWRGPPVTQLGAPPVT